jgi:hypothetical protein
MKADISVTLTPTLVKDWERQARELEAEAAKMLAQAKTLSAKVEAANLFLGPINDSPSDDDLFEKTDANDSRGNMTSAIEAIVNSSDKPLTKATMKTRLSALDFPEHRLGNYFYTCIQRLKGKQRISVLPDGRLWKASQS